MDNSSSPLRSGAFIALELTDEGDPDSSVIAYLESTTEEVSTELCNSFGAEIEHFIWLVKSAAAYHGGLPVQDRTGRDVLNV